MADDLIQCDCQTRDPALLNGESSTREPTPAESESDAEEPCAKFVTASQYDPKPVSPVFMPQAIRRAPLTSFRPERKSDRSVEQPLVKVCC